MALLNNNVSTSKSAMNVNAGDSCRSAMQTDAASSLRLKIKRKKVLSTLRYCAAPQQQESSSEVDSKSATTPKDAVAKKVLSVSMENQKALNDIEKKDAGTWVRTVAGQTNAESFGPCEPGTSVLLEGIVWNETLQGILVVNVTWRGKSYVGTLLDCSKYEWAAPRLCDSPNGDLDLSTNISANRTPGGGGKQRNSLKRSAASTSCLISSTGKSCPPNGDLSGATICSNVASTSGAKRQAISCATILAADENTPLLASAPPLPDRKSCATPMPLSVINDSILEPRSPTLFECPMDGCRKKYSHLDAYTYHHNAAHPRRHRHPSQLETCEVGTSTEPWLPQPEMLDSQISPATKRKLLSEQENASLESLFKVVDNEQPNQIDKTSPSFQYSTPLQAEKIVPQFSDVSDVEEDDELEEGEVEKAPTLERHISPLQMPLVSSCRVDMTSQNETVTQKHSLSTKHASDKSALNPLPSVKPEPLPSAAPQATPLVLDTPLQYPHPSMRHMVPSVSPQTTSSHAPFFQHPRHPPIVGGPPAPLFGFGGPSFFDVNMYAPPPPPQPPLFPLHPPPSLHSSNRTLFPLPPQPFYIPAPPQHSPLPSAQRPGSRPGSGAEPMAPRSAGGGNAANKTLSGAGSTVSPSAQRHHLLHHHHTHNYPLVPPEPYGSAMIPNQSSTSSVSNYPPFQSK